MIWKLTVFDADEREILFVGNSSDPAEIEACAREAKRMRPDAVVMISGPTGQVIRIEE